MVSLLLEGIQSSITFKPRWSKRGKPPCRVPSSLRINVVICWFGDPAKKASNTVFRENWQWNLRKNFRFWNSETASGSCSQLPTKRMNHLTSTFSPTVSFMNIENSLKIGRCLRACCYGSIKGHCILVNSFKDCQGLIQLQMFAVKNVEKGKQHDGTWWFSILIKFFVQCFLETPLFRRHKSQLLPGL